MTNFFANPQASSADALLDRLRVATAGLYDVAGEIGRGGMAVVYLATDMRLGRKVAIKVMEPRLSFTPGMAERFLQEARIAARLQHHNIIVVHEVQQDEELIFFVMRLVEGGSLDEIYKRLAQRGERLPLDQAQWILWQATRALAYAHSEGIVHRDVKPANILVTTKGEVVVTDFGIAKAADGEGLTKSGMAIGTPVYMSPEQFTGNDPVSGAADQYALGVAAYELLTGAPPFAGDLYRLIAAHGSTVPIDLRESRPECPAPLAEAVMRMLEKRAADRWPSLDAILPVLGLGLSIDGSNTRSDLALVASELQAMRAASVAAWGAVAPTTPAWSSGSRRRSGPVSADDSVLPPNGQAVLGGILNLPGAVADETGSAKAQEAPRWSSNESLVAPDASDGDGQRLRIGSVTPTPETGEKRETGPPSAVATRSPALLWGGGVAALVTVAIITALALPDDSGLPATSDPPSVAAAESLPSQSPAQTFTPPEATTAPLDPPAVVPEPPKAEPLGPAGKTTPEARPPAAETPARNPQTRPTRPSEPARTTVVSEPPVIDRVDSGRPPASLAAVAGPGNDDMRALAADYVSRLNRGDFRVGELASFFSRTTSAHSASMVGEPRAAGREGDVLLADVDVQVERTLGSGAVDRRTGTVRLTLRGRAGNALIERATPGALTRVR